MILSIYTYLCKLTLICILVCTYARVFMHMCVLVCCTLYFPLLTCFKILYVTGNFCHDQEVKVQVPQALPQIIYSSLELDCCQQKLRVVLINFHPSIFLGSKEGSFLSQHVSSLSSLYCTHLSGAPEIYERCIVPLSLSSPVEKKY